jgi:hypothetical protein
VVKKLGLKSTNNYGTTYLRNNRRQIDDFGLRLHKL